MSKPCIKKCGRETNSKTGICVPCMHDSINVEPVEVFDSLDREIEQPPRDLSKQVKVESEAGTGTKQSQAQGDAGTGELTNRRKTMSYKKACSREGCGSTALKKGLCYAHLIEEYGKDALPPSMRKSAIQGGGNLTVKKEKKKVKVQAQEKQPFAPPLVRGNVSEEIDIIDQLKVLIEGHIKKKLRPFLADLRRSIDEIQKSPVAEVLAILQAMAKDIEEWEAKLS